jgi:hypothetical protein
LVALAEPTDRSEHVRRLIVALGDEQPDRKNVMRKMLFLVMLAAVAGAPAAFAQSHGDGSSGAQVQGAPGNKSGAAVSPSGQAHSQNNAPSQDMSGSKGLPGNKSGPAQQPPKQ